MSSKDYQFIAGTLRACRAECETDNEEKVVEWISAYFATALDATQPRFDEAQFLQACGVTTQCR